MDEVKNDDIEKALNELVSVLGIKEFVDQEKLIALIHSKKVKECIKAIALYLGLPIEVNISYVPNGYRPSSGDGFQSTHLVKTNLEGGGIHSITAQVSIPSNLPFYASERMVNFPINVRLSENCAENPATLIAVMAHELSHIVLHSIWHKEKHNEFYTDLTAMLMGFARVMKAGRKIIKTNSFTQSGFLSSTTTTSTQTTTYGYLSDNNFYFAFTKITKILKEQRKIKYIFLKKLNRSKKQLTKAKRLYLNFHAYLEYVDKNLNQKITPEDGLKIMAFHQPGYADNFKSTIRNGENRLNEVTKYVETLNKYTERSVTALNKYGEELRLLDEEEKRSYVDLQKDVNTLKKYVGIFYIFKLKTGISIREFKSYKLPGNTRKMLRTTGRYSWFLILIIIAVFILNAIFNSSPSQSLPPSAADTYQTLPDVNVPTVDQSGPATTAQPQTAPKVSPPDTQTTLPSSPPHIPVSLANGTVLNRNMPLGLGYIKIDNGTNLDAVAKLVDLSTNDAVFKVYIQAGQPYTIQKISDGNYKLVFGLGTDWNEATGNFLRNASYQKFDESFNFSTYTTDNGNYTDTHYATYSVTLNGVIGGNAKTNDISPSEFAGY